MFIFRILFLFVIFIFCKTYSYSQNLDSLKRLLKLNLHDTSRCRILNCLVNFENDDKAWPVYNEEMRVLAAKKLRDKPKPITKEDSIYFFYYTTAINNKGLLAMNQGQFQEAIKLFNQALKLANSTNDFYLLGDINNNLAGLYDADKTDKRKLNFLLKSLEYRRKTNDRFGICQVLTNLASSYVVHGEKALSKKFYQEALQIAIEIGDKRRQAHIYANLGVEYDEEGQLQEAITCETKAISIFREIDDFTGLAVTLHRLGNFYFSKGQYKETELYYNESYKYAVKQDNIAQLIHVVKGLYSLEKALNHPDKALEHYIYYIKLRDSVNSISNKEASIKQGVEFEYEKKKAIDQAKHDSQILLAGEREKRQKIVSWSIGAGLLLMLILVYFIYARLRESNIQKKIIVVQKMEVEGKNIIIEEKQKEIIDSITYAKRIQYSLLAHDSFLKNQIAEHFVFFKPKDIVSGDFYWATETVREDKERGSSNLFYLAVCDSTGHGVPGAFMSLLNISFLNEAITEKKIFEPHLILNHVRSRLIDELSRDGGQDGMDGILLCRETTYDANGNQLVSYSYASANNSPVLISRNGLEELPKDKMPVGKGERKDSFKLKSIDYNAGDILYLYTDGYADQFGGAKGKKFKYKALNQLLLENCKNSMEEQKKILENTFVNWKGNNEQVDDVCVIGLKL